MADWERDLDAVWPSSPTISRATAWSSSPERRSRRSSGWDASTRSTTRSSRRCTTAPAPLERRRIRAVRDQQLGSAGRGDVSTISSIGRRATGWRSGRPPRGIWEASDIEISLGWMTGLEGAGLSPVVNVDEPSALGGEWGAADARPPAPTRDRASRWFEGLVRGHAERAGGRGPASGAGRIWSGWRIGSGSRMGRSCWPTRF